MKFESGTSPSVVRTRKLSSVDNRRSFWGRRTRISISSSEVSTRMVSSKMPRVTSCTMAPTVRTSAPYRPAFSTSTSICQSIPGRGRVSSTSFKPSVISNLARAIFAASCRSCQLSPFRRKLTGLASAGPIPSVRISVFTAGILASSARRLSSTRSPPSSVISARSSHGISSIWIWPIASSGLPAPPVFWFKPPAPANANELRMPLVASTTRSTLATAASFSASERLPRCCTKIMACSGSVCTKNSTPLLFFIKAVITMTTKNITSPIVTRGIIGLPVIIRINQPNIVRR